ncbi:MULTISPECIES: YbeD family protein [unclassified Wenzhouxiangella]|uniref:YbeD family protein n=1 Tax=unclassified Wenzhouxiangella TaxID=2613841 RepID=UPI000E327913|nr:MULTISPECIES: DUF493 domain-containing protein [unclassified Wenzhouxiangella]RFF27327.1 DUF493 domain-containing protein [Wenzhouxiangella sp. 15181]RFP68760.1 DUF493 domain-containing protein [Wenzhouxiangella sp. 15190]
MAEEQHSPLEFPCRWPVKAMVTAGEDSLREVLGVIARHAELPEDRDVRIRPSRHGRYESITVVVEAQSRRHLEIIYTEMRALDVVKMTL